MLQREAERIDAHVAVGAGGIALVRFQLLAHGEAAEELVVGGDRAGIGGRRRNGVPRMRRSTQSPRFTGLVRSGAEVAVRIAPRRSRPPRWNASAPSHQFAPGRRT